jgi:cyclohexanone monooxygenase
MGSFNDLLIKRESNETAAEFVRARIRETVRDPALA